MSKEEVLILAMTTMRSGICTAGFTSEPDPASRLRWVRPVKEHGNLTLNDMTDAAGRVVQCSDVVELELQKARPQPPHTEDVLADWIYHRPRLLRRLEGEHRARFLAAHTDRSPADVMIHPTRSLCLVRPEEVWATFSLDPGSEKYEARLGFRLPGVTHQRANSTHGIPVTDIRWRTLGRTWLNAGEDPAELALDHQQLLDRLRATDIYLALGLSRGFQGETWLLVIGVHVVPDYEVTIDYKSL
jgi:hypothetical protein